MSFDWKGYLTVADDLLYHTEEHYCRSAISRAYYAVFCIARNKKGLKDYSPPDENSPGVHKKVILEYKNSTERVEQKVGNNLDKLRRSRNLADYREDEVIDKPLAERMVASAKSILKVLERPLH